MIMQNNEIEIFILRKNRPDNEIVLAIPLSGFLLDILST